MVADLSFDVPLTQTSGFSDRRTAKLRLPLAAIFGEKRQQLTHALEVDGVSDIAADPRGSDQPGAIQLFQMERRARWCGTDSLGNLAGGQTRRALPHEKAENGQALIVGQCGKASDGIFGVHSNILQKLLKYASVIKGDGNGDMRASAFRRGS
jgi:hypothetical protein